MKKPKDNVKTFFILINETKEVTDYLKIGNYAWLPKSNVVFNITLEEAKHISLLFHQDYFVFGTRAYGVTMFELYVLNDNDYISRSIRDDLSYEFFDRACENFNKKINEAKNNSEQYRDNFDKSLKESLKENKTGRHYYICRTMLYCGLF